jgi:hypothetical protein
MLQSAITPKSGGMAEWLKAVVLKTSVAHTCHRGFESHSLRLPIVYWGGARVVEWGRLLSG